MCEIDARWDAPVVSSNYKYKVTVSGKTSRGIDGDDDDDAAEGNDEQVSIFTIKMVKIVRDFLSLI